MEDISIALDSTFSSTAEQLEVGTVLDKDHVSASSAGPGDDSIELQSPGSSSTQRDPCGKSIVAGRYNDDSASLASSKSRCQR